MTEKRFTIESERINNTYSIHILKDEEVIFEVSNWDSLSMMHKRECEDIVDLLNELNDENEQLKKQLKKKEVEPIIDKLKEMEIPYGYYSDSKSDVRLKELFKSKPLNCTEHWDGEH